MRPSEMVEGLDAVAKRSERQEQVDRMKQRSGRIIMNEAVHVDEKGRTWQRVVLLSIVGFIAAVGALVGILMYLANSGGKSVQECASNTNAVLALYTNLVHQFDPVPASRNLTVDDFKAKLMAKVNEQLQQRNEALKSSQGRPVDAKEIRRAIRLLEMGLKFEDGFGQPFAIEAKGAGVFSIRSPSKGPNGESFATTTQVPRQDVKPEAGSP